LTSSTAIWTLEHATNSMVKTLKRIGHRTDPCGTPDNTL